MQNTSSLCILFPQPLKMKLLVEFCIVDFLYDVITSVTLVTTNKSKSTNCVSTIPTHRHDTAGLGNCVIQLTHISPDLMFTIYTNEYGEQSSGKVAEQENNQHRRPA